MALALAFALAAPLSTRADDAPTRARALERSFLDEVAGRPYLQFVRLDVRASGRSVTLLGSAGAELERALLEVLARNLAGVGEIRNEIVVDESLPKWRPGDAETRRLRARNVLRQIRRDPELLVFSTLRTLVDGRDVVLRGSVALPWQHVLAVSIARELAGPSGVRDELEVLPDASRTAPLAATDEVGEILERDLDSALAEDPLLHGFDLATEVRDGKVFLVGRVPRRIEEDYALEVVRGRLRRARRAAEPSDPWSRGPLTRRLATGALDPTLDRSEVSMPGHAELVLSSRAIVETPR